MKKQKSAQVPETEERKCPECGSRDIGTDETEMYCKKCGYVFE
ncbi:MAG TPA: TFIIB-type zinc ribbon-containing protein [Candidatus Nanoarchaeia archaeon]|nr:TFIIB-type zinc ribbon-containing protein [Candidatus Nanoarchaeia archaeon]